MAIYSNPLSLDDIDQITADRQRELLDKAAKRSIGDKSIPVAKAKAFSVGVGGPVASMGARALSVGASAAGMDDAAESLDRSADYYNRATGAWSQASAARNKEIPLPEIVTSGIEGAATQVPALLAASATPAGPLGTLGYIASQAANESITSGRDAGLKGKELATYAGAKAANEVIVTKVFSKIGGGKFGGAETIAANIMKPAQKAVLKESMRQQAKALGFNLAGETLEELFVETNNQFIDATSGVDETALDPDTLAEVWSQTVAQTIPMVLGMQGVASVSNRIDAQADRRRRFDAAMQKRALGRQPKGQSNVVTQADIEQDMQDEAESQTIDDVLADLLADDTPKTQGEIVVALKEAGFDVDDPNIAADADAAIDKLIEAGYEYGPDTGQIRKGPSLTGATQSDDALRQRLLDSGFDPDVVNSLDAEALDTYVAILDRQEAEAAGIPTDEETQTDDVSEVPQTEADASQKGGDQNEEGNQEGRQGGQGLLESEPTDVPGATTTEETPSSTPLPDDTTDETKIDEEEYLDGKVDSNSTPEQVEAVWRKRFPDRRRAPSKSTMLEELEASEPAQTQPPISTSPAPVETAPETQTDAIGEETPGNLPATENIESKEPVERVQTEPEQDGKGPKWTATRRDLFQATYGGGSDAVSKWASEAGVELSEPRTLPVDDDAAREGFKPSQAYDLEVEGQPVTVVYQPARGDREGGTWSITNRRRLGSEKKPQTETKAREGFDDWQMPKVINDRIASSSRQAVRDKVVSVGDKVQYRGEDGKDRDATVTAINPNGRVRVLDPQTNSYVADWASNLRFKQDVTPEPKPEPKLIGKNKSGQDVFEDENGVRTVVGDDGRETESVRMVVSDEGVKPVVNVNNRADRYKTVDELPVATDAAPVVSDEELKQRILDAMMGNEPQTDPVARAQTEPEPTTEVAAEADVPDNQLSPRGLAKKLQAEKANVTLPDGRSGVIVGDKPPKPAHVNVQYEDGSTEVVPVGDVTRAAVSPKPPRRLGGIKEKIVEKKEAAAGEYEAKRGKVIDALNKLRNKPTVSSGVPLTPDTIEALRAVADMMVAGVRHKAWSFAEIVADIAETAGDAFVIEFRPFLERGWKAVQAVERVETPDYDGVFSQYETKEPTDDATQETIQPDADGRPDDGARADDTQALGDGAPQDGGGTAESGDAGIGDQGTEQGGAGDGGEATGVGSDPRGDSGESGSGVHSHSGGVKYQFRINTENTEWFEGGAVTKLNRNIEAIRAFGIAESEGRLATAEEQDAISKFTGWGHLKQFFIRARTLRQIGAVDLKTNGWSEEGLAKLDAFTENEIRTSPKYRNESEEYLQDRIKKQRNLNRHRIRLAQSMSPADYAAARSSIRFSHYSDHRITTAMWKAINRVVGPGHIRVLEPSEGSGIFWGTMPEDLRVRSEMVGIDKDRASSRVARHMYQQTRHLNVGFEDISYPDGYFDVAATNVPFHQNPVLDPSDKSISGRLSLHNYFFAKTGKKLRPGGVLAFITTHFTLDAIDPTQRKLISEQGLSFVGAIRLPSTAFGDIANTAVVTDIILMQKALPGQKVVPLPESEKRILVKVDKKTGAQSNVELSVSKYFQGRSPRNVIGKMTAEGTMRSRGEGEGELTVDAQGMTINEIAAELDARFAEMPFDREAFEQGESLRQDQAEAEKGSTLPIPEHLSNLDIGKLEIDGNKLIVRLTEDTIRVVNTDYSPKKQDRARAWFKVRDAWDVLRNAQTDERYTEKEVESLRGLLNEVYDQFVKEFGYLNSTYNRPQFADDWQSDTVLSLENVKREPTGEVTKTGKPSLTLVATKADVFTKRTQSPGKKREAPTTFEGALAQSFFTNGRVDIGWIADAMKTTEADAVAKLRDKIIKTPSGNYELMEMYLSGNIVAKIADAERAAVDDGAFLENVAKLRAALPTPKTFDQIKAVVNSSFMPVDVIKDFIRQTFGANSFSLDRNPQETGGGFTFNYANPFAAKRENQGNKSTQNTVEYAVIVRDRLRRTGLDVMNDMLIGRATVIMMPDPMDPERSVLDEEATTIARAKRRQIERAFQAYFEASPKRKQAVEKAFNDSLNGYVNFKMPDWVLSFDGMADYWRDAMRPYQREVAGKIALGGNTLVAHKVGYGKTLSGVAGIMEQRRLGVANKPVAAVPKHLFPQWVQSFSTYYPKAKVYAPEVGDFDKSNRKATLNRILTGDWDAVIIPNTVLKRMPMSPEYTREFYGREIDAIEELIDRMRAEDNKDPRSLADVEAMRDAIVSRMNRYLNAAEKDSGPFFDELGIDSLTVDEAHHYKNLPFYTKNTRIAGINPTGSQQAFDLLMKADFINEVSNDRNLTFLTGTPIANSMTEAWVMMRYLMPNTLKQAGVFAFDDWKNSFGEVINMLRVNTVGTGYRNEERFQQFINTDVLFSLFSQVADVKMKSQDVAVPPLRGGKPTAVVVPSSDVMKNLMLGLAKRAASMPDDPSIDNILVVMNHGAAASIDMRMLGAKVPPDVQSKVDAAADSVAKIYKESMAYKGTQLIWSDRGVPKKAKKLTNTMKELGAWMVDQAESGEIEIDTLIDKWRELDTSKKSMENLKRFLSMANQDYNFEAGDDTDEGVLRIDIEDEPIYLKSITSVDPEITVENPPPWNVYQATKDALIARGVPADQIAFIHDYETTAAKLQLFQKMNDGAIRVLLGNTPRLGTGANIQKRLIATHHLDVPYRPADVEQRDGRILRSGNEVMELAREAGIELEGVDIFRYVTEGSIDSRYWQIQEDKGQMLTDFFNGTGGEVGDLSQSSLSAAEMKSEAVANPLLKRRIELEKQVRDLQEEYRGALSSRSGMQAAIENADAAISTGKRSLKYAKEVEGWYSEFLKTLPEDETTAVEVDGVTHYKKDDIGSALARKFEELAKTVGMRELDEEPSDWSKENAAHNSEVVKIATIGGKEVVARVSPGFYEESTETIVPDNSFQRNQHADGIKSGKWKRTYFSADIRVDGLSGVVNMGRTSGGYKQRIINFLQAEASKVEGSQRALDQAQTELREREALLDKTPVPDQSKLKAAELELESVATQLGSTSDDVVDSWVATQAFVEAFPPSTPFGERMLNIESDETYLGYVQHPEHGRINLFNRAHKTRPPKFNMVYLEAVNEQSPFKSDYHLRDDVGVLGLKIAKETPEELAAKRINPQTRLRTERRSGGGAANNRVGSSRDPREQRGRRLGRRGRGGTRIDQGTRPSEFNPTRRLGSQRQSNLANKRGDDTNAKVRFNTQTPNAPVRSSSDDKAGIAAADVVKTISRIFNMTTRIGSIRGRALGTYLGLSSRQNVPRTERLAEEAATSIAVHLHETGHHIDRLHNIVSNNPDARALVSGRDPRFHVAREELRSLDYLAEGRPEEGFAEWVRIFLTEPETKDAQGNFVTGPMAKAPEFTKWMTTEYAKQNPELFKQLADAKAWVDKFADQSLIRRLRAQISNSPGDDLEFQERMRKRLKDSMRSVRTGLLDRHDGWNQIDKAYREAGGQGPLGRDVVNVYEYSASVHAERAMEDGVHNIATGAVIGNRSGLWPRVRKLLKSDQELADAELFAYARHTVWAEQNRPGYFTGMNPRDAEKLLERVQMDNPDQYQRFEKIAVTISEVAHDLLKMRVLAGTFSRKDYDTIIDMYGDNYFPMMRAMDGQRTIKGNGSGYLNVPVGVPGRSRKGSGRPVMSPFESLHKMAHDYYSVAARGRVFEHLRAMIDPRFGGVEGMGWVGTPIDPKKKKSSVMVVRIIDQLVSRGLVGAEDAAAAVTAAQLLGQVEGVPTDEQLQEFADRHGIDVNDGASMRDAAMMEPSVEGFLSQWDTAYEAEPGKMIAISYDRNGNPYLHEYDAEIYKMLTDLSPPHLALSSKLVSKMGRAFKSAAVSANATFAMLNLFRDYVTFQGRAKNVEGFKTLTEPIKQGVRFTDYKIRLAMGESRDNLASDLLLFHAGGGSTFSRAGMDASSRKREVRRLLSKSIMGRLGFTSKHPRDIFSGVGNLAAVIRDAVESVISISDAPPRLAEMNAVIRSHGFTPLKGGKFRNDTTGKIREGLPEDVMIEAMMAAANATVNFKKGGTITKAIDVYVPFAMATINANATFAKQVANMRHFGKNTPEGRLANRYAVYLASTAALAAIYYALRRDDEDYKNAEDWELNKYWTFGWDGVTYVRVPKPQDEAILSNAVESMMGMMFGDADTRDVLGVVTDDLIGRVPTGGGPVKGLAEIMFNYDFYRGRAIEPQFVQDFSTRNQYTNDTRYLSILMGQVSANLGLSPMQVEHLINATTANQYEKMHRLIEGWNSGSLSIQNIPGARAFYVNRHSSRPISDFYDRLGELKTAIADSSKDNTGDDPRIVEAKAEAAKLDAYRAMMAAVTEAQRTEPGDKYKYVPYIVGLAREALGYESIDSSPSPLRMAPESLPEKINVAIAEFAKKSTDSALLMQGLPEKVPKDEEGKKTFAEVRRVYRDRIDSRLTFIEEHLSDPAFAAQIRKVVRSKQFADSLRREPSRGELSAQEFRDDLRRHREQRARVMAIARSQPKTGLGAGRSGLVSAGP